jgi:basic membrane protein A
VEKGISTAVKAAVLLGSRGHGGGSYVGTLANGGAVLAPYHFWTSKVPAKLQTELLAVKAAIIAGKIVPATKSPV